MVSTERSKVDSGSWLAIVLAFCRTDSLGEEVPADYVSCFFCEDYLTWGAL